MRENGYYHVKFIGKWILAKWIRLASDYGYWELFGSDKDTPSTVWDHSFDEIDENRIIRYEGRENDIVKPE